MSTGVILSNTMETAYAIKLPDRLDGLEKGLRDAYADIRKSGVTFANSEKEALSHFFYARFRNKARARTILRTLRAGREKGKGLDELIARGARVYEIPEIISNDGELMLPDEVRFHKAMILAEDIAKSRGDDLSNCTSEKYRQYKNEAEGFVNLAMKYGRENQAQQAIIR